MAEYSSIARTIINMWNSGFTKTILERTDAKSIKFNFVKLVNSFKPTARNSNKKLKLKNYKKPSGNIIIKSHDGCKIVASVWLNPKDTNKWVVGSHGFNSNRFDVLYLLWHYRNLGYNIITFDFRNHGDSDHDIVSWGYKEKWDLIAVIDWLCKNYNVKEIGLVGVSMGGFTSNYLILTEEDFVAKSNIKWVISDSSYMSAKTMIKEMVAENTIKVFETYANSILNDIFEIYKNEYDVDLKQLDFIKLISKDHIYKPVMYIHNRYDRVTSFLDSFKMCDIKNNIEHNKNNELLIYDEGYNHTKSIVKFTEDYIDKTTNFVKRYQLKNK